MKSAQKILVVAAHPDDEVLGCGGVLSKFSKSGSDIRVAFVAEGTTCRYSKEEIQSSEALAEISTRRACAIKSLEILGVRDVKFHNYPCGRLDQIPIIDLGKLVESEIADFRPHVILTHSHIDANSDHLRVHQAVIQATRPGAQNLVSLVLAFEVLSSTEWRFTSSFTPNVFVSIDLEISQKIEALKVYESEIKPFPFPRSPEGLLTIAKMRGMQSGCEHAEAFQLVRGILQ